MTERLSALLHDEADVLRIPPPPGDRIVAAGRGLRRRRRIGYGVAGLALAGIVGTAVGLGLGGAGDEQPDVADDPGTGLRGATFTVGVTVYLDGGGTTATIDDQAVKSSYVTSAGLLVRHGDNNASDGGGPQRYSLVTRDGTVKDVSVVTEEVVPGVDPSQPYLAYAVVENDVVQVVVHDVSSDQEVARVAVAGARHWGGWSAPPVALSGDLVYVGTDDVTRVVDWRTGAVTESDVVETGYPEVHGGRTTVSHGRGAQVVDASTGQVLYTAEIDYPQLSPDGRFVTVQRKDGETFEVVDLDSGDSTILEGQPYAYGWTPEDDLARLVDGHVETCSPSTGECATADRSIPTKGGGRPPTTCGSPVRPSSPEADRPRAAA